jgi:tRNA 2-thiouridine synthesizing protein D
MNFGILVNEGPYQRESSDSAYLFCRAAIDAVVLGELRPAVDHGVDLVVCVAAALRRGIKDEILAKGFRISGLGQLVESAIHADRLVVFGD